MLSADGKGSVLCKSCETVLYQLSRAVVFFTFFFIIANVSTFYPLYGSKRLFSRAVTGTKQS